MNTTPDTLTRDQVDAMQLGKMQVTRHPSHEVTMMARYKDDFYLLDRETNIYHKVRNEIRPDGE